MLPEQLHVQIEAVLFIQRHYDRHAAGQLGHGRIGNPVRRGNQHFVARVDDRLKNIVEALLAAATDLNLLGIIVPAVTLAIAVAYGLPQLRNAVGWGVAGVALVYGLFAGSADMRRGGKVGLADTEIEDIHALGLELLGFRIDGQGGGGGDLGNALGKGNSC